MSAELLGLKDSSLLMFGGYGLGKVVNCIQITMSGKTLTEHWGYDLYL